ncbi:MAG: RsmE family RNA methyltransferase [Candidatus Paceibacterota bacterium]|jgi:16S rRNA (uracil1498-N3)-methyltransferase
MRFHRFYVNNTIFHDTFDVTDRDLVHQWRSVFRYNVGSQVILFDGSGTDYLCMITSLRNLGATVSIIKKTKKEEMILRKNVWLCVALIKKDNFELLVQKATELGVNHIVPIICEHSEKRKLKLDRMQKITIEASEQSGRSDIPEIHEITTIQDLFQGGMLPQEKIAFHPTGISFKQYINSTNQASFAAFIGPEGGFSDKEIAQFKSYNMPIVSLGTQILRTETAAIAVASLLLL